MRNQAKFMVGASLAAVMTATAPSVYAQDASVDDGNVEEVLITGSRRAGRTAADAPAPVDVISGEAFSRQADSDMMNMLRNQIPSFNVNTQPISDAGTLVRPANLRGMAADQTLVLLNSKRRHRASVISFLGGGLSDGAQGPDISQIPAIALKEVQVLRDGAAAQYGSDAIAGVLNFILNDSDEGGSLEAKYSSTYEGDGDLMQFAGTYGMPIGDAGFLRISADYKTQDAIVRASQRKDALKYERAGFDMVSPAMRWGAPETDYDFKGVFNFGMELSDNAEVYAWGNYGEREVVGGFYFRNPGWRAAVYRTADDEGNNVMLIGDLTDDMSGNCDAYAVRTGWGHPYDTDWAASVAADPNCFHFTEVDANGFTPDYGGVLKDTSVTAGAKGEMENGLGWDISASTGSNRADFYLNNTVNASLGPNTPRDFDTGAYIQREKLVNIDLVYPMDLGLAEPVNVAGGFEWHEEEFEVEPGDDASWEVGPLADQGFGVGSNGFMGFNPAMVGVFDRSNIAFYLDLDADVTERLTLTGAVRYEDFNDFGGTTNYKFGGVFKASDNINLRSTYSTGFRAPTPGQRNITNVSTTGGAGGTLVQRVTLPSESTVAVLHGGAPLTPEKSKHFSLGTSIDLNGLTLTLDYYNVKITDRIALVSPNDLTMAEQQILFDEGNTGAFDLQEYTFFANSFDTRTQGFDVVASYNYDAMGGSNTLTAALNYNKTKVGNVDLDEGGNPIISLGAGGREELLENNLPKTRANITWTHDRSDWRALVRMQYHSKYMEHFGGDGDAPEFPGSEITFDVEGAYNISEQVEFIAGVENVLSNNPDRISFLNFQWSGSWYPETAPMGVAGGTYYAKLKFNF